MRSPERQTEPLSGRQISDYHRDGVILVRGLLSDSWLAKMRRGVDTAAANLSFAGRAITGIGKTGFNGDVYMWKLNDDFYNFMLHSPASRYAQQLLGSEVVRHFYDQTFNKAAGCHVPTPWHHDVTFWSVDLEKNNLVSIWVTLDPVTRASSGLEFIKGSHTWDHYWKAEGPGSNVLVNSDHEDLPDVDQLRADHEFFSPDMEPGDALIFNAHIVHGSSANYSTGKPRRAFASRWSDDKTIFEDRRKTSPLHWKHGLKTGDVLSGPLFPQVLPEVIPAELSVRERGPEPPSKTMIAKSLLKMV
jgi:ectoine hydroxylase-related dioxygenase (phytanoyl-CoA dioxygenase family)